MKIFDEKKSRNERKEKELNLGLVSSCFENKMTNWNELWALFKPYTTEIYNLSPSLMLMSILSQIRIHLTHFKSNEIKYFTKVNVLVEIHMMVSSFNVFDEIRENPYLRKNPPFH